MQADVRTWDRASGRSVSAPATAADREREAEHHERRGGAAAGAAAGGGGVVAELVVGDVVGEVVAAAIVAVEAVARVVRIGDAVGRRRERHGRAEIDER